MWLVRRGVRCVAVEALCQVQEGIAGLPSPLLLALITARHATGPVLFRGVPEEGVSCPLVQTAARLTSSCLGRWSRFHKMQCNTWSERVDMLLHRDDKKVRCSFYSPAPTLKASVVQPPQTAVPELASDKK